MCSIDDDGKRSVTGHGGSIFLFFLFLFLILFLVLFILYDVRTPFFLFPFFLDIIVSSSVITAHNESDEFCIKLDFYSVISQILP